MRQILIARAMALVLVAAILALAWIEKNSALSQALRSGRPCLVWLALRHEPSQKAPALFLGIYQPARRTLDIVFFPAGTRLPGGQTLESAYGAARKAGSDGDDAARRMAETAGEHLSNLVPAWPNWSGLPLWVDDSPPFQDEPPLEARNWILRRTAGPRQCSELLRAVWRRHGAAGSWTRLDRFLLSSELHRLPSDNLRPAWLPPEAQAAQVLGRCLLPGPAAAPPAPHPTVEVLNASGRVGIASRAKNILRLNGADVMSVGNAGGPLNRTLVYDRTGGFENAAAVRRMLGCAQAQALTQVDLKRLVDVTVVLAEDCPLQ